MGFVVFQGDFLIHGGIAVWAAMRTGIGHADVAA